MNDLFSENKLEEPIAYCARCKCGKTIAVVILDAEPDFSEIGKWVVDKLTILPIYSPTKIEYCVCDTYKVEKQLEKIKKEVDSES